MAEATLCTGYGKKLVCRKARTSESIICTTKIEFELYWNCNEAKDVRICKDLHVFILIEVQKFFGFSIMTKAQLTAKEKRCMEKSY